MNKLKQLGSILLLSLGCIPLVHAADLLDVYLQALDNDPKFKIAYSEFMSDSQNVPRARAPLRAAALRAWPATASTQQP